MCEGGGCVWSCMQSSVMGHMGGRIVGWIDGGRLYLSILGTT